MTMYVAFHKNDLTLIYPPVQFPKDSFPNISIGSGSKNNISVKLTRSKSKSINNAIYKVVSF